MVRHKLSDAQWKLISDIFPPAAETGRPRRDRRQVVNAILWILKTGSPWRDLPAEYHPWKTIWDLFDTWNADGTLDRILSRLTTSMIDDGEIDEELWCVDGTIVRAARCAAGGGKKGGPRNLTTMP